MRDAGGGRRKCALARGAPRASDIRPPPAPPQTPVTPPATPHFGGAGPGPRLESRLMGDWKFGGRQGLCTECERAFADGEPLHSLLALNEGAFSRSDLCAGCFGEREPSEDVVYWRTKYTVVEKKGVQLDLESIHALFGALEEREERGWRELRYLLCLILMRKRRLKVLGVRNVDGDEVFVVRRPRTEDEKLVHVFDFSAERRGELRETLQAIFDGADLDELDPEGAPPAAAEPALEDAEDDGGGGETAPEPENGAPGTVEV